jgi:hypothetical protein
VPAQPVVGLPTCALMQGQNLGQVINSASTEDAELGACFAYFKQHSHHRKDKPTYLTCMMVTLGGGSGALDDEGVPDSEIGSISSDEIVTKSPVRCRRT